MLHCIFKVIGICVMPAISIANKRGLSNEAHCNLLPKD